MLYRGGPLRRPRAPQRFSTSFFGAAKFTAATAAAHRTTWKQLRAKILKPCGFKKRNNQSTFNWGSFKSIKVPGPRSASSASFTRGYKPQKQTRKQGFVFPPIRHHTLQHDDPREDPRTHLTGAPPVWLMSSLGRKPKKRGNQEEPNT